MGKLLRYNGSDKVKKRIADVLNVTDVRQNGVSIVNESGIADISGISGDVKVLISTQEGWDSQRTLISERNTLYIYSDHDRIDGKDVPALKVGDGTSYLIDMAYVTDNASVLMNHIRNDDIHVTAEEKEFWNNKVRCDESVIAIEDTLIFTTH